MRSGINLIEIKGDWEVRFEQARIAVEEWKASRNNFIFRQ